MSILLQSEQLRELAEKILTEIPRPKDHWEIAARLEIFGIRDVDAREVYGSTDVFDLAGLISACSRRYRVSPRLPRPSLPPCSGVS